MSCTFPQYAINYSFCYISLLPYYHITILPYYRITILPYYHITILPYYRYNITILPYYHIRLRFSYLLDDFNLPFLQPRDFELYCQVIHQKGAPLDNCFGFVDGTVRPTSRPGKNQRLVYNGHKNVYGIKFQSVVIPNGPIVHIYGPVEGKRHGMKMLTMSALIPKLQQYARATKGRLLCMYGDPAYQINVYLQSSFRKVPLTADQKAYNKAMSQVSVSVEWLFGDIVNWFKFYLSAIGKMYLTCAPAY